MRVRVYGLLSFYDEDPDHLHRCVSSLAGLADHVLCVEGAYQHYPDAKAASPPEQRFAIVQAAREAGIKRSIHVPSTPWAGEVEKRAAMFQFARDCGATPEDWLLVIDADCHLAKVDREARERLAETSCDVAEIRAHHVRMDDHIMDDFTHRALFRALPGLTCKWMHAMYVAPLEVGWRYLWHTPACRVSQEPSEDLSQFVTLHHRQLDRSAERDAAARAYYRERERLSLELAPPW